MTVAPIYLDYAATTPVDPRVAEAMTACLTREGCFGNAASLQHGYGREAHDRVEQAREQVANLIGASPAEIIWTSGATESNNLALIGAAEAYADRGRHIISMKTEHKSVVDSLRHLEQQGWRVSWLAPEADGRLSLAKLAEAFCDETVLVSLMLANNETGVLQDIEAIAQITHERSALLHVDAAQAAGKLPVDVGLLQVDLMSLSAHKLYGPKGIGALYVRRRPRVRIIEQMHGGGHERGMRSGTLPVHQIVGMGAACELAGKSLSKESQVLAALRDQLWQGLSVLPDVFRNGSTENSLPNILNLSFAEVDGEALHAGLSGLALPLAISSGSACTAASQEASYVLRALGWPDELAYASVRFSLGRWTTEAEIEQVIASVVQLVLALRARSPVSNTHTADQHLVDMVAAHPQYSEPVWRYFVRGLQSKPAPMSADCLTVDCQTPGSRAVLQLAVEQSGGRVSKADFQAYGCVSTIAVGAWLAEWLVGRDSQNLAVSAKEIEQILQLAAIKRHCALLAEDAVQQLGLLLNEAMKVPGRAAS